MSGVERAGDAGERVRVDEAGVVVEEEQQLAAHVRHAGVAAGGDAHRLGQVHRAHAVREIGRLPGVAHHHDVGLDALLHRQRRQ